MRFSFVAVAALAGSALAQTCDNGKPHHGPKRGPYGKCMTKDEMTTAIDKYAAFISDYTEEVALEFLSDDFAEYCDSINTLTGRDLGSQTFNKTSFMAGAQAAKNFGATFTLNVMDVYVTTCNMAVLSWYSVFKHRPTVERELPSRGISVLQFSHNEDPEKGDEWQVSMMSLEFNSLVWLLNSGGTYSGGRPGSEPENITVEAGVYPAYDELDQPEPSEETEAAETTAAVAAEETKAEMI